jgi:hypothetical protein
LVIQFVFEYHRGHVAGSEHGAARADADIRPGSSGLGLCCQEAEGRDEEQRIFFMAVSLGFRCRRCRLNAVRICLARYRIGTWCNQST